MDVMFFFVLLMVCAGVTSLGFNPSFYLSQTGKVVKVRHKRHCTHKKKWKKKKEKKTEKIMEKNKGQGNILKLKNNQQSKQMDFSTNNNVDNVLH